MKSSDNAGSLWSIQTIISFCTRRIEHSVIAVAVAMRSGCPARLPSPKTCPLPKTATTASFPRVERTVSFTLPLLDVKDRVRGTALREDGGFLSIVLRGSPAGLRKVRPEIEGPVFFSCHASALTSILLWLAVPFVAQMGGRPPSELLHVAAERRRPPRLSRSVS